MVMVDEKGVIHRALVEPMALRKTCKASKAYPPLDSLRTGFFAGRAAYKNQRYSRALSSCMKARWSWRLFSQ